MAIAGLGQSIESIHSSSQLEEQKSALRSGKYGDKDKIRELSEQFESIFMGIVLKSMRKAVPDAGLVKKGNGEEIFRSMLDTEYAKQMASQRSSGLAESIERHLLGLMQPNHTQEIDLQKMQGLQVYHKESR